MHTKDILKLSFKNIKTHLGRNLILVAVGGIIFMLIFVVNLWLQGLENTYQKYANVATDGKVIIVATNTANSISATDVDTETTATKAEIIADLERFGAKIVGERELYGTYGSVMLDVNLVNGAIEVNPSLAPRGSAPTLVSPFLGQQLLGADCANTTSSVKNKIESYRKYRNDIIGKTLTDASGTQYYIVGLTPSGFGISNLSFRGIDRKNDSPLNAVLEMIPVPSSTPLILAGQWELSSTDTTLLSDLEGADSPSVQSFDNQGVIAVFENSKAAYQYFKFGKGQFMGVEQKDRIYSVNTLAGMSPETQYIFQAIKTITVIACIILAAVALVVIIFTSIRLVDQDRQNIALYYNLGATKRQVKAIYFYYFLWLAIGALILATFVAVAIVIIYSVLNRETLGVLFMVTFSLPEQPEIILCGLNFAICGFAILLLISPALSVAVNGRKLKNISR